MIAQRIKQIIREARKAAGRELHDLFFEVYGADFAGAVTEERARLSIHEACKELLAKPVVQGQVKIMEELMKALIAEAKQTNVLLTQLVERRPSTDLKVNGKKQREAIAEAAEKPEEKKPIEVVDVHTAEAKLAQGLKDREEKAKPKEPEITIENLRDMATKYSAAFGMEELLALNQKVGGAKKLSAIAPAEYATLYREMEAGLAKGNGKKATEEVAITVEQIKTAAQAFADKNGAPALTALLKAFGADKLTNAKPDARKPLDPSKYAAFLEAVANA